MSGSPSPCHRGSMIAKREYRRTSHCVYLCDYHIVLPTKYRHLVIDNKLWSHIYGKLMELTKHHPTIYFKEANHDNDHIHLLVSIPPQKSVGSVIRLIKSNTSRRIKQKFPVLKRHYWGSDGYFVSTVGVTTDVIKRYIANQGELDTGQTATLFD